MIKKQSIRLIAILILLIISLTHVFPCVCFADGESDTLKNAIDSFKAMLSSKKTSIEGNDKFAQIDAETQKIVLQHYFIDAINEKAWPSFWDDVFNNIANNITNEEDKHIFLDNIPEYVNDFIKEIVFNNGTVPEYETSKMSFWDFPFDNIAGVLLYPAKLLLLIVPSSIAQVIQLSMTRIGSDEELTLSTIDAVVFNKVPVTDANIFKYSLGEKTELTDGNVLFSLRQSIAGWYTAIRNLCIALSLAVLVYIGIRMAISSIADDKAKYKKMLKDWLVSFALIFVLHYIMVGILTINDGLVNVFDSARIEQEKQISDEYGLFVNIENYIDYGKDSPEISLENRILEQAFSVSITKGMLASVLYFMLNMMTFLYIIVYIKRVITISLLTMIAPIITVTYPIDKVGDGKAQALNKWFKEYAFNVLIQPFHCIIYLVFVQNIFYIINQSNGFQFGKIIIAIMMFGFMYKAEDIVKSIFGFETTSLGSAALLGAAVISKTQKTVGNASKVGKLGNVKGAGDKAKAIKQVNKQTPNDLPQKQGVPQPGSGETNGGSGNNGGTNNSGGTNGDKKKSLGRKIGGAAWRSNKSLWTCKCSYSKICCKPCTGSRNWIWTIRRL